MDDKLTKIKIVDELAESKNVVAKRVRTAFIHALYQFEEIFGEFAALDKEDNDPSITEAHEKFYDLYMEFRKRLMDFGNHQIRLGSKDLERLFRK